MKSKGSNVRGAGNGRVPSELPLAWMDPMSWRLPSGQALAEFALQSGFLAPLLLGGGRKRNAVPFQVPLRAMSQKRIEERPGTPGTFRASGVRESRFREQ